MSQPGLLSIFALFNNNIDFSEIWTWIFGVEANHADHLTSTALHMEAFGRCRNFVKIWPVSIQWKKSLQPHQLILHGIDLRPEVHDDALFGQNLLTQFLNLVLENKSVARKIGR